MKKLRLHSVPNSLLTICILTNGARKQRLQRVLSFIEFLGFRCIILDSASTSLDLEYNRCSLYIHCPDETTIHRLLKIPNLVESKYLLLSPDDDFFLPLGIQRCLQFLEENDQYTSAQGQRIYFREGKVIEWGPMYENYTGLDFWEDDVRERLLRMSCSMHFIYSVMRTEVFSKIISTLENTESKNPNSAFQVEYVFNYLLALFGKHKILPILYSARERHPVWHQNLSFSGWINDTQDQAAVNFRRSISRMYQSSMKLSDLDAQKLEQEITNYFVRRPKAKTIENLSLGRFKNLAKRFIRTFSKGFESGVLLRWRFSKLRPFFPLWRKSYWRYYFEIWKSGNVVNFYKDLSSFIQFLQRNKVSD